MHLVGEGKTLFSYPSLDNKRRDENQELLVKRIEEDEQIFPTVCPVLSFKRNILHPNISTTNVVFSAVVDR